MTEAAASVPFSAAASAEFVIEHAGITDDISQMVVTDLVSHGFERMTESDDPNREDEWARSIVDLTEEWRRKGGSFERELQDELGTRYYREPDDPPATRVLKKLGICPLWPFCT